MLILRFVWTRIGVRCVLQLVVVELQSIRVPTRQRVILSTDDGQCADESKGIYATEDSCSKFRVCYSDGKLLAKGKCPCGRFFDEETRRCLKPKGDYYRHPHDCERYMRCTKVNKIAERTPLRCNVGYAFDMRMDKPICKEETEVPGCGAR